MIRTINQKWQVTIPIEIRRRFDLKPGTQCLFIKDNKELILITIKKKMTLEDYQNILKHGLPSSEEFMAQKQKEKM